MTIKGPEKAAILIMTLKDENVIRDILSKLDPSEKDEISAAMSQLGQIDSDCVEKVWIEFLHDLNQSLQIVGNVRTTERFFKQYLDDQEYNKVIAKIKHANTSSTWDMISNLDDLAIAQFIKHEYPQTAALILSKLPGYKAAKILKLLNQDYSIEVLRRMVHMDSVEPEILTRVERALESEIDNISSHFNKSDNISIIAEIFNNFSKDDQGIFMSALRYKTPDAVEKIAKSMLTFDDLLFLTPETISLITQKIDNNVLITALSGVKQQIRDLFLSGMSQRVVRMIIDEIDSGSRFAQKDILEAQSYILKVVKGMINDGSIILNRRT